MLWSSSQEKDGGRSYAPLSVDIISTADEQARLWSAFALLTHLETLDMGLQVQLGDELDSQDQPPIVTQPLNADALPRFEAWQAEWIDRKAAWAERMEQAREVAAVHLTYVCPNLRYGWWWSRKTVEAGLINHSGTNVYERRGWTVKRDENGTNIVDQAGALWLSEEFVNTYG